MSAVETALQAHLRAHGPESLTQEPWYINAKQSERSPGLWLFKYDQINSPMREPVCQQARGCILDSEGWHYVSRPFDKFFNLGDPLAAPIDWSTARVLEKLDGSLMQLHWWNGCWRVASSGHPDASGRVDASEWTFETLFWDTFHRLDLDPPGNANRHLTFLFELMSPYNRIVVRQPGARLVLIGARENETGVEYAPDVVARLMRWPGVAVMPHKSAESCTAAFGTIDPLDSEGFVVVDSAFRRVKVKHPGYVVLHSLRGEGIPTPKRALWTILAGNADDITTNWPEWKPLFEDVRQRMEALGNRIEFDHSRIDERATSQKEYAEQAIVLPHSAGLFHMRAGKVASGIEWVTKRAAKWNGSELMSVDSLAELLGLADAK